MQLRKKVLSVVLVCLVILIASGAVYCFSILQGISGDRLDSSQLHINQKLDKDVSNIAVFGLDGRNDVEGDRSDTIMLVTVNYKTGNVKVTSLMRDLMVKIPETRENNVSYEKVNAAYDYGGPELAVQTLNENLDLNISDYVSIDFKCLVDVVDALGGVEINIPNESVLHWTNQYIMDDNDKVGKSDPFLTQTGVQTVTGIQALSFCRERYSDNDYMRTKRQREVFEQIAQKLFNSDIFTDLNLLGRVYPYVQTSLPLKDMTGYAKTLMSLDNKTFDGYRVPLDDYSYGDMIDGVWYLVPDTLADNAIVLHKILYGNDSDYTPSDDLMKISDTIAGQTGGKTGITIDTSAPFESYLKDSANENVVVPVEDAP